MKNKLLRIILFIMLIGTFFTIFKFSSQDAKASGGISNNMAKFVLKQIDYEKLENKEKILGRTERVLRKIAHFSIYTLVGILLMLLINTYKLKETMKINYSLIIGGLYAVSDEIHQLFVPGRSGQITDVMLDFMGVALGVLLILMVIEIHRKKEKNMEYTQ